MTILMLLASLLIFATPGAETPPDAAVHMLIEGDLGGRTLNVPDVMKLTFEEGNHGARSRVTRADGAMLYSGDAFTITPYAGYRLTAVTIKVTDDNSRGWTSGSNNLTACQGDYKWIGNTTETLTLKLVSSAGATTRMSAIEVYYESVTAVPPVVEPFDNLISPAQAITIDAAGGDGTLLYYTTDGTQPTLQSKRYTGPFRLDLSTGMNVRAMAVAPDGSAAYARRRYYFNQVENPEQFVANGCPDGEVSVTMPVSVVGAVRGECRVMSSNSTHCMAVRHDDNRLDNLVPGTVLSGMCGLCDSSQGEPFMRLTSAVTVASGNIVPEPQTSTVGSLRNISPSRYLRLNDVQLKSGSVYDPASGQSYPLLDRYGVLTLAMLDVSVTVCGFSSTTADGQGTFIPWQVTRLADTEQYPLTLVEIGNGKIEMFAGINESTMTPVGEQLPSGSMLPSGATAYLFMRPSDNNHLSGVVAGPVTMTGEDDSLEHTSYGLLYRHKVTAAVVIVATFAPGSGIGTPACESAGSVWYTIGGVRLDGKPERGGLYIEVDSRGHAAVRKL